MARNFKMTESRVLCSRAYKLFRDKSIAANLGASSMKLGAMYLRLGFSLMVRVFRSFRVARLPLPICSKWGHLEMDRNSVRTLVKSSRPTIKEMHLLLMCTVPCNYRLFYIFPYEMVIFMRFYQNLEILQDQSLPKAEWTEALLLSSHSKKKS